ncbi:MAG: hypothetical protein ACPGJS_15950 [Flammeovirgaceae bacterium]
MRHLFIKTSLFTLCLILSQVSLAQYKGKKRIKLKNGSAVSGKIITVDEHSVKLETKDKNVWVFNKDEIEEITALKGYTACKKGVISMNSFGLMVGRSEVATWDWWGGENTEMRTLWGFTAQTFNGYQFNKHLALGLSVNFDAYLTADADVHLPIALGSRWFMGKKSQFFCGLDIGKGIPLVGNRNPWSGAEQKATGGLFFQPSIGMRLPSKNGKGMFFQTGFKKQQFSYEEEWIGWRSVKDLTYNRWFFSLGTFI